MKYRKNNFHQDWYLFKFIVKLSLVMVIFFAVDYYINNSDSNGNTLIMNGISKVIAWIKSIIGIFVN